MLVPKEPFVSIWAIFLSDEVSHEITLPSCVVLYNILPSGERARAHASPVTSRVTSGDALSSAEDTLFNTAFSDAPREVYIPVLISPSLCLQLNPISPLLG